MHAIKRNAIISYTAAQMYALVDASEEYPKFLPWCSGAEVIHRDEDEARVSLTASGAGLQKTFTTRNLLQKDKMIEIRLVDGPFKHLEGFWLFENLGAQQCRVSLDLEFEFAGGWLDLAFSPLFYQVANTLVDAFCERAKEVYA